MKYDEIEIGKEYTTYSVTYAKAHYLPFVGDTRSSFTSRQYMNNLAFYSSRVIGKAFKFYASYLAFDHVTVVQKENIDKAVYVTHNGKEVGWLPAGMIKGEWKQ